MSSRYFKHTIQVDSSYGNTDTVVVYTRCNSSVDREHYVYESGEPVDLEGTEEFIKALANCILGIPEGSYTSKEVRFIDLPEKVKVSLG